MWELDYKKAEHWRIDAFELWCWRRCLRVPWTARRSKQSILKKINPEYSLEELMLKLKLYLVTWCEELTLEKTLILRKSESKRRGGGRGWDGWMACLVDMNLRNVWEIVEDGAAWCAIVHGVRKSWTQVSEQQQEHCQWNALLLGEITEQIPVSVTESGL